MAYIITIRKTPKHTAKPATREELYEINDGTASHLDMAERDGFLASRTKAGAIALYLYEFGFTWKCRPEQVEVSPMHVVDVFK